jgi:hypothetical protein
VAAADVRLRDWLCVNQNAASDACGKALPPRAIPSSTTVEAAVEYAVVTFTRRVEALAADDQEALRIEMDLGMVHPQIEAL